MAAGAAMAVVGWWTGYKLGGVVALFTAEFFENLGVSDYWQTTFLICLLYTSPSPRDRQKSRMPSSA